MRAVLVFVFIFLFTQPGFCQKNYFYTGKDYGSEALFNPFTLIINGGYDITQLQLVPNTLTSHLYGRMTKNVVQNLFVHPFQTIDKYGWKLFLRTEFLPLSFKKEELQWIPNYQQHLIGGGMLYTAMKEWYELHNVPVPWLMSSITIMGQHFLNEVMETGPYEGYSVDEISDIYIFDLGGILLFSFDPINEFFSKTLNLSDWSLQASVALPDWRVNAGQYFSIKWKFPFSEDYSLFYRYGMGALFGISKKVNPEDNLSVGLGFKSKHLVDASKEIRQRTIETSWHAGVFYDRNNSLLASLVLSGVKEYFCMIDIYPGIIKYRNFSPGIWSVIGRNGEFTFGFSTRYVFSLGYELKNL
ncbi:MAG: hypothetical protein ACM3UR_09330 [Bacteroidota bacterium]|jgi:hypothetical protein|nr:hypothetical protein [Ignavibacteria bacterium]MCU7499230.1 hypothetical protein [Ignavibacteria bacterium]MCU7512304.1 hypothetical protein [Ignavibacteria bacterium]MCU7520332.1 hypothetical protein [Ignavibacteria bacterium]MCU7523935.1 hypothetical protein [Ignavibacteria bacterium]